MKVSKCEGCGVLYWLRNRETLCPECQQEAIYESIRNDKTARPYQPSNGAEGSSFMAFLCEECTHYRNETCKILLRTMIYRPTDPEYPKEWVYSKLYGPFCLSFAKTGSRGKKLHKKDTEQLSFF